MVRPSWAQHMLHGIKGRLLRLFAVAGEGQEAGMEARDDSKRPVWRRLPGKRKAHKSKRPRELSTALRPGARVESARAKKVERSERWGIAG
jgi:hypothetical protein